MAANLARSNLALLLVGAMVTILVFFVGVTLSVGSAAARTNPFVPPCATAIGPEGPGPTTRCPQHRF